MSESDYAYECMRADLLGLPKPDRDSIPSTSNAPTADTDLAMAEEDQLKVAAEETAAIQDEQMKGLRGLDEMHNILSITQKKLNNLKCGIGNVGSSFSSSISGSISGFTGFIKQRVGGGEGSSGSGVSEAGDEPTQAQAPISSVDKLDAMLERAESAEIKMSAQNKQMQRMINK